MNADQEQLSDPLKGFIIELVEENIFPEYNGLKVRLKDTFQNRQVVFSKLYYMGFNIF